jgi:ribosomal protein L34
VIKARKSAKSEEKILKERRRKRRSSLRVEAV